MNKTLSIIMITILATTTIIAATLLTIDQIKTTPTTTTSTSTTTTSTTTQPITNEHLAYLTIIERIPAYKTAGATETQIWEQLAIICRGFDGGLAYYEIGKILVDAAAGAGIAPFGYSEAGTIVGTATTLKCPQYDGWQNQPIT